MTDWIYPDSFDTMTVVANWIAAVSTICCVYLLASWAALPVDKTNRHYLSVCFTFGVLLMNVSLHVSHCLVLRILRQNLTKDLAWIRGPSGCSTGSVLR